MTSSSSASKTVLPRPQWGPYSWSWKSTFEEVLTHVLAAPEVVTPPEDVQLTVEPAEFLREQYDVVHASLKPQINLIDDLTAELHDALVELMATDSRQFTQLLGAIELLDTLTEMVSSGTTEVATLDDFCDAATKWLRRPTTPPPSPSTTARRGYSPADREAVVSRVQILIIALQMLQKSLLTSVQESAREERRFRALETSYEVQLRDLTGSIESALLGSVNTMLNDARQAATSPVMQMSRFDAVWQPPAVETTVVTSTYAQMDDLIRLREGSIGIAGPRGAGKTRLIEYFTSRQALPDQAQKADHARLGVVVAAPVDYDAREFVLYLYAQLCEAVINAAGAKVEPTPSPIPLRHMSRERAVWWTAGAAAVSAVGVGLLIVALLRRLPIGLGASWADPGVAVLLGGVLAILSGSKFVRRRRFARFHALIISGPAVMISAGLVLFLSNGGWQSSSSLVLGGVALLAIGGVLWPQRGVRNPVGDQLPGPPEDRVVDTAREHLDAIRTQQSNTVERSVTVKLSAAPLPVGLDAAGKYGNTRQDRPKGHPELVKNLRDFLAVAQEKHKMIIAIDELDKLAKPEKVENFLNDIKAVFGVKGCLFLVSVSEDAAAGFERKGVPFRDVFDSAFDDVISLSHMDSNTARSILFKILNGWTKPFVALCYVTSGGLARDLMRCTRELVSHRDGDDRIELAGATLLLYRREALARLRAVRHELLRISENPKATELLRMISVCTDDVTPGALRSHHNRLVQWAKDTTDEGGRPAARLAYELGAFMLFASTVLEFFNPCGVAQRLEEAEKEPAKSLARLAQARQMMAMSPEMALDDLGAFRSAWKLD